MSSRNEMMAMAVDRPRATARRTADSPVSRVSTAFEVVPLSRSSLVKIAVELLPANGSPQEVEYRWDSDTDILSAQLLPPAKGEGMSGSVGLEGSDGSWLILDVSAGRINGV